MVCIHKVPFRQLGLKVRMRLKKNSGFLMLSAQTTFQVHKYFRSQILTKGVCDTVEVPEWLRVKNLQQYYLPLQDTSILFAHVNLKIPKSLDRQNITQET